MTSDQIASTGATGYEIYYIDELEGGASTLSKNTVGATKVTVAGATTDSQEIDGLDPAKTYKFVIYAVNGSTYSKVSSAATGTAVDYVAAQPAAVSSVAKSNLTGATMTITGTYTGTTDKTIVVKVAEVGADGVPTKWQFSTDGGVSFGAPGYSKQFLGNAPGLELEWDATSGPAVVNDTFTFDVTAATSESH